MLKRYQKVSPYSTGNSGSRSGVEYLIYLTSSLFFTGGFLLLFYQFLSPLLSLASRSSYLRPVSSEYLRALTSQREGFVFKELEGQKARSSGEYAPEFHLSLPTLGFRELVVETNSASLAPDKRLGHLAGSSLPGARGLTVIYGHSASPLIFNEADYQTIFSKLDKLKAGDRVQLEYLGKVYVYIIRALEVVAPGDLSLQSKTSSRGSLALITCFPFGSVEKRLVVYGDLSY